MTHPVLNFNLHKLQKLLFFFLFFLLFSIIHVFVCYKLYAIVTYFIYINLKSHFPFIIFEKKSSSSPPLSARGTREWRGHVYLYSPLLIEISIIYYLGEKSGRRGGGFVKKKLLLMGGGDEEEFFMQKKKGWMVTSGPSLKNARDWQTNIYYASFSVSPRIFGDFLNRFSQI